MDFATSVAKCGIGLERNLLNLIIQFTRLQF